MNYHLLGTYALGKVLPKGVNIVESSMILEAGTRWLFWLALGHTDHVLMSGGNTPDYIEAFKEMNLTPRLFAGKEVYAFSAGVSVLTAHSFNFDHCRPVDGLGFINVTSIVHYDSSKEWAAEYLAWRYKLSVIKVGDSDHYVVNDKGLVLSYEVVPLPTYQPYTGEIGLASNTDGQEDETDKQIDS